MTIRLLTGTSMLDMASPRFAEEFRDAIGAKPDDTIEIVTPQFTRPATEPAAEPPKTPAEYDALRALSAEALRALGLRPWDSPDKPDYMGLWLLPGGWYAHIPRDYPLVFIDGTCGLFAPGRTDNDIRYGCLVYGIIPAWAALKRALVGGDK